MQIIGNFRKRKAWTQAVLICLFGIIPYYVTYLIFSNHSVYRPPFAWLLFIALLACLLAFFGFLRAFQIARRLLLFDGEAVWIYQGKLIFLDERVLCVPVSEIIAAHLGREKDGLFVKNAVVTLELRNGQHKSFPTASLAESPDELINRLHLDLHSESSTDQ